MVNIITALEKDLPDVIKLWQDAELIHKPYGRDRIENLREQLALENVQIFLATKNETCIGTAMATHDGRKGWINRLAVLKKFRRKGIGKELIKAAEDWLSDQGIEIFAVLIDDPNDPSMNLFLKEGYTKHTDIIYFTKKKYPEV